MANREGSADGKFGHTNDAYGHDAFNLEDPAFKTGLETADFQWPTAADGATVDAGFGQPSGGSQTGRFARGGATTVYPLGTANQINRRFKPANDPASAKSPTGSKSKRYT
ncbi:MAG: hypothetical protein KGL39_37020 [Patescibacteria group bacterium]|nr:hypothetical protein [Patescibacteria group bacterium]